MYKALLKERKEAASKNQKKNMGKLKKDLRAEAGGSDPDTCFVVPGRDAGAGLSLRLDNEDDSSSDEDDVEEATGKSLFYTMQLEVPSS